LIVLLASLLPVGMIHRCKYRIDNTVLDEIYNQMTVNRSNVKMVCFIFPMFIRSVIGHLLQLRYDAGHRLLANWVINHLLVSCTSQWSFIRSVVLYIDSIQGRALVFLR